MYMTGLYNGVMEWLASCKEYHLQIGNRGGINHFSGVTQYITIIPLNLQSQAPEFSRPKPIFDT
jgi:hypothetical protein